MERIKEITELRGEAEDKRLALDLKEINDGRGSLPVSKYDEAVLHLWLAAVEAHLAEFFPWVSRNSDGRLGVEKRRAVNRLMMVKSPRPLLIEGPPWPRTQWGLMSFKLGRIRGWGRYES